MSSFLLDCAFILSYLADNLSLILSIVNGSICSRILQEGWIVCGSSPRDRRVKPDISISIYGSALGSFPHFRKPGNILDGVDKRAHGPHGSATTTLILYFHAIG